MLSRLRQGHLSKNRVKPEPAKGESNGKGKGDGKSGKPTSGEAKGNGKNATAERAGYCSHCGKSWHSAKECWGEQRDETAPLAAVDSAVPV